MEEFMISPLTRLEGHGRIIIRVTDGSLTEVELNIIESPRLFEKFLQGKPAEEVPRISERICGICYTSHHLASVKAVEAAWEVQIPEAAEELRRLLNLGGIIMSHTLHLAFLAVPDLLDLSPEKRHILGVGEANPEVLKKFINIYEYGLMILRLVGGRKVHIVSAIPGGMSKNLSREEKEQLLKKANSALQDIASLAEWFMGMVEKKTELTSYSLKARYCMGLVRDGDHELYDGNIRVVDSNRNVAYQFKASEYLDYIAERVSPHSYVKLPYLRKVGFPKGIYRVGPLPRMAVTNQFKGDLSAQLAERYYKAFGKIPENVMAYNAARFVENVQCVEASKAILESEVFYREPIRVKVDEKAGDGVGVIEAPRGILIHHYQIDENGIIRKANIITPTAMNAPSIENDLKVIAEKNLDSILGSKRDEIFWKMEVLTRTYDPCISCATHTLKIVVEEEKRKSL